MASIAPMLRLRPILASFATVIVVAVASGCGGSDDPKPSIPGENALAMIATLQEIQANVDNGSCLVAADKVGELVDEINQLPADVDADVKDALERGAVNLRDLVDDPDQCSRDEQATTTTDGTTTKEQTTTQETTTQETTTQETTTTPPTTTTTPTNPGGGVGPPGGASP